MYPFAAQNSNLCKGETWILRSREKFVTKKLQTISEIYIIVIFVYIYIYIYIYKYYNLL